MYTRAVFEFSSNSLHLNSHFAISWLTDHSYHILSHVRLEALLRPRLYTNDKLSVNLLTQHT